MDDKNKKMGNYQNQVITHLGNYKKEIMRIEDPGIFRYKSMDLEYDHILPKTLWSLNILEMFREHFYNSSYSKINYHRYFHHLNSSQALCINLFYPLIVENKLTLITELLELPKSTVIKSEFEFISDLEKSNSRKTNFDFFYVLDQLIRIFFEVKYTEQHFGKAKENPSHIEKFEKTYLPLLNNNPYIRKEFKAMSSFLEYYQMMRNLVHIREDSLVVFLYPEENSGIDNQVKLAYQEMVTDLGREKMKILSLEEAVEHIIKSLKPGRLLDHYHQFNLKYSIR